MLEKCYIHSNFGKHVKVKLLANNVLFHLFLCHRYNLQVQPPQSGEYPGGKWGFGLQLASPLHHQGG